MTIQFHIHYRTSYGQGLIIDLIDDKKKEHRIDLHTFDGVNWMANIEIKSNELHYRYAIQEKGIHQFESGKHRKLKIAKSHKQVIIHDQWKAKGDKSNIFRAAAFTEVFLKSEKRKASKTKLKSQNQIKFQLTIPNLASELYPAVVGNTSFLGSWEKPVALDALEFPVYNKEISADSNLINIEYKYVLCDRKSNKIIQWESGDNRRKLVSFSTTKGNLLLLNDDGFRYDSNWWRAAGIAIPVFSQRSEQGYGIGEFLDIKSLSDWASETEMKIIQVLPVNDTIATKTWTDSYPYAAISVYALHPIYINIDAIAKFKRKKDQDQYNKERKALNKLSQVDFEQVLNGKFHFLQILFEQESTTIFASKAYKEFFKANKVWLVPYAAFSHLRDEYQTPNFNVWPKYSNYDPKEILKLCNSKSKSYRSITFYFFLQYIADKQLKEAKAYARNKKVVLKGDLPIGIYRYSADAWVAPHLYNMNEQAGAPPDDYAILGQNWGFPTYNWEEMAKDNYLWWQKRMQKLAEYFDALRIDHILGFFRIWQVPLEQIEGTLGLFNPRMPYSKAELQQMGLTSDIEQWCKPYIHQEYMKQLFGKDCEFVVTNFLDHSGNGMYLLKKECATQVSIREKLQTEFPEQIHLLKSITYLASEVLLIEEPNKPGYYNPRITLNTTHFYKSLGNHHQNIFDRIYADYYFRRHDEFWKNQAEEKLPALLGATDMLICGEDLGMIPASVPGVMDELNIIPLEIQRMSKSQTAFGEPWNYDYFSVCSPSCHDMSTIRGWWQSDSQTTQQFFNEHLKRYGSAPAICSGQMVQQINQEHFDAPSMLAIFPIQDLVGMSEHLRRQKAAEEQINEPSNPKHYWRFRFHLSVEELMKASVLNRKIKEMVLGSGR